MKTELPPESFEWMTPEIKKKLATIKGSHLAKKRKTILMLAFALANNQPVKSVFSSDATCDESTWYMTWQNNPEIKTAYDACLQRALEWSDEQTAAIEAHYTRVRRQAIAKHAAEAPEALAKVMNDSEARGADRISAANSLLAWADPDAVQKSGGGPAPPAGSRDLSINFPTWSDAQLDKYIENLSLLIKHEKAGEASEKEE